MDQIGVGTVLAGGYRLEEQVSRGSLGDVWRCVDEAVGRRVAAKLLGSRDFIARERVHRGWVVPMAKIDHRGVVHIHRSAVDPRAGLFVIMEYVEGEPLRSVLAREGRLAPARTMDIVAGIADALGAVHARGIVHRDLSPTKVRLRPDATVVLTAFGLGYQVRQPDVLPIPAGTTGYVAPEQFRGEWVTRGSDIFSVGVLAYECLAGQRPFNGASPLEVALSIVRDPAPAAAIRRAGRGPLHCGAGDGEGPDRPLAHRRRAGRRRA